MSDSPLTAPPTPRWDHARRGGPADRDVERLRSRLLRIALISVISAAVLGIAGVLAIAFAGQWATFTAVTVVVGSVLIIVIAAVRATAATRELAESRWTPARAPVPDGPVVSAPAAPAPPVAVPRPEPAQPQRASLTDDPEHRREVFGKLARRLQSLINRAIKRVDALEREIEDPELLRGLYEIDHLATRVRRQAENLAVLGGEAPQRRSNTPVSAYAVLRSAVAEIEHYKQISIVAIEDVHVHGHAVAEIIHLLAELLENATTFSAPDTGKVVLRAQKVTAGLAIEVQDRGLGMTTEDLQRINRLLDGTTHIDIEELLEDGRIGMAVVRELAQRHGARVRLQTNIFGGIDAFVVLPHHLLSERVKQEETPAPVAEQARDLAVDATLTPGQLSPVPPAPQPLPSRHARADESRPSPVGSERQASAVSDHPEPGYPEPGYPEPGYPEPDYPEHDYPAEAQPGPAASQELPPLPVREAGSTFSQSSGQIHDANGFGQLDQGAPPPPLPQRRGQSHLRRELHEPVAPTRPLPGHNTNLMAAVQQGFDRGREEQQKAAAQSSQPQQGTTQGESVPHGR